MRKRVLDLVTALDLSKPWEIDIRPHVRKRSLDQNALLHKWEQIIADDTGNSKAVIHEYLMKEFLVPQTGEMDGKLIEVYTTTKLKVPEFSSYLSKIDAWAGSTLGIMLPHPEDMQRNQ